MPYRDPEKLKAAQQRYYLENKSKYSARNRAKNCLLRNKLIALKESTPCKDCGLQYPHYVMDFDHCRGTKLQNIGTGRNFTLKTLTEEIDKCDIVCSNCHRHRTFMRRSKG